MAPGRLRRAAMEELVGVECERLDRQGLQFLLEEVPRVDGEGNWHLTPVVQM